jgi:hypothetical protein
LANYTNGKPQYVYIETSNQGLYGVPNERGPTADEVRGEVWDAIIHNARGIVYFPFTFSPTYSQNGTPASVLTEMTTQDALIASLASVINSGSLTDAQRLTLSGDPTLEGCWREYNGTEYYFVLNLSHTPVSDLTISLPDVSGLQDLGVYNEDRSVTLDSNGLFTDSFGAYQLHVYETGAIGPVVGAGVPEPGTGSLLVLGGAFLARRPRRRACRAA